MEESVLIQRLVAGSAALLAATVAIPGAIAPASAAMVRPACTGDSVIASMPLKRNSVDSSWNYGYVQLWYNYCTGNNWGRVVSLLSGASGVDIIVYNDAGSNSGTASGPGPTLTSGQIYSPNNPAGAFGEVIVNGFVYFAEADQAGVSCGAEINGGTPCPY